LAIFDPKVSAEQIAADLGVEALMSLLKNPATSAKMGQPPIP
jgi:hypothetical protein